MFFEYFIILASEVTGCISVLPFFFSLLSIHTGITSSAIWLKIFAIVAGIKKYKSLIEKNKKNYDKVVLLVNSKLNSIEIKISKASID